MKEIGLILVGVGYLWFWGLAMNHDPPAKIVPIQHAATLDRTTTYTAEEVGKHLSQVGMTIHEQSPLHILPATVMLAGTILILISSQSQWTRRDSNNECA